MAGKLKFAEARTRRARRIAPDAADDRAVQSINPIEGDGSCVQPK
jgi:hypothetical protein